MTKYEEFLNNADEEHICVEEKYPFNSERIKGLYCDGNVVLSDSLRTDTERTCVLAEELGHYYTSSGDIIEINNVNNRKQELHARNWAYQRLISLQQLIEAYRHGCRSLHDVSEYLDVTPVFLQEAIDYYRTKYGTCTTADNYVIYFEPYLGIFELRGMRNH